MNKIVLFAVLAVGGYVLASGDFIGGKKSSSFQMSSQKSSKGGLSGFAQSSGAAIGGTVEASNKLSN